MYHFAFLPERYEISSSIYAPILGIAILCILSHFREYVMLPRYKQEQFSKREDPRKRIFLAIFHIDTITLSLLITPTSVLE